MTNGKFKTLISILIFAMLLSAAIYYAIGSFHFKPVNIDLDRSSISTDTNINPLVSVAGDFDSIKSTAQSGKVIKVADGDTFTVQFSDGSKKDVRMIGIDTPESVKPNSPVECFAIEASNFTKNLLLNKAVFLTKDISDVDRYGRILRYIYLEDGTFVNKLLVSEGYAFVYTYPPDVDKSEEFITAQKTAREQKKGLWNGCTVSESAGRFKTNQIATP